MKNLWSNSVLFFLMCSMTSLNAQNEAKKPNYITSGYYQLVYEADIAHREGNDSLAFAKLQEAEKCCPLINQILYREIDLYVQLLVENGDFTKAIAYSDTLAGKYGDATGVSSIGDMIDNDSVLYKKFVSEFPAFKDFIIPALIRKSEMFYTPERRAIFQELAEMSENDQNVRPERLMELQRKKVKTHSDSLEIQEIMKQMNQIDSVNLQKMFDIIEKYGFPNTRLIGDNRTDLSYFRLSTSGITVMLMHCFESQKLQEILIQSVRKGECEPFVYGSFVDRRMLEERKKYIFAIYTNTTDDRIFDLENLDNRRLSIGMPTREMEQRQKELIEQFNEP